MEVNIKKIQAGRFASFYGFGTNPEELAMKKLLMWCEKRNIDIKDNRIELFGFNNPNQIAESEEYGYEFWLKVDLDVKPEDYMRIIEYNGGYYAIVECTGVSGIFQTWQALYKWCKESKYNIGYHQALERVKEYNSDISKIKFELCCPITLN